MKSGNKKDLDELLKVTLSKVEKPSIYLNYEVKRNLRKKEENRSVELWVTFESQVNNKQLNLVFIQGEIVECGFLFLYIIFPTEVS